MGGIKTMRTSPALLWNQFFLFVNLKTDLVSIKWQHQDVRSCLFPVSKPVSGSRGHCGGPFTKLSYTSKELWKWLQQQQPTNAERPGPWEILPFETKSNLFLWRVLLRRYNLIHHQTVSKLIEMWGLVSQMSTLPDMSLLVTQWNRFITTTSEHRQ